MFIETDHKHYLAVQIDLGEIREEVRDRSAHLLRCLSLGHFSRMGDAETGVLLYLMAITICRGQLAREVSVREICEGVRDEDGDQVVDTGTGYTRRAVQRALNSLCEAGYLNIYAVKTPGGHESGSRVYEIDCKKVEEVAQKLSNSRGRTKDAPPVSKDAPLHIYISASNSEATSSFFLAANGETKTGGSDMAFVGKKRKAPEPKPTGSALEVIAKIQANSRKKVEALSTVAATRAPRDISKDEMQSLFDRHARAAGLDYRLMVTNREFGFLRKRLAENPPSDFSDMVRWSLAHWTMIAQQNRKAVSKDVGKDKPHLALRKALPEAPHFSTFCYWYPYFLRCYQNWKAGRFAVDTKAAIDKPIQRVVQLERQLAEQATAMALMRRRMATTPQKADAPVVQRTRPILPARTTDQDLMGEVEFPDWEEGARNG